MSNVQSPNAETHGRAQSYSSPDKDSGHWTLDFGLWTLPMGHWSLDFGRLMPPAIPDENRYNGFDSNVRKKALQ